MHAIRLNQIDWLGGGETCEDIDLMFSRLKAQPLSQFFYAGIYLSCKTISVLEILQVALSSQFYSFTQQALILCFLYARHCVRK